MGREFASRERRTSDTTDDESSRRRNGWGNDDYDEWEAPSGSGTPDLIGELSLAEAKRRYDRDFGLGVNEVYRLMRMEEAYGSKVHQWVDEGIPGEAMETVETRERFRERKDTPIPWDIEDDHEETLQRSLDAADDDSPAGQTGVPNSVRDVISSPGRSLDPTVQRAVEERMGESFGDVRIHTDAKAATAADEIDARAFTVENHVAFGAGEYDPESAEGQHVLVHELAHVRQQTDGVVSMLPRSTAVPTDGDGKPRQSPTVPGYVTREWTSGSTDVDGVHLQRFPSWDDRMTDPAVADDPLATFAEERNIPESLVARIETLVDDDRYEDFLTDIYRIAESQKDVGEAKGDVGEVLSAHPESGILSDLVPELRERDELVAVPKNDNSVKGFQVDALGNPEFDKVIINSNQMDVVGVVEEKTGHNDSSRPKTAIKQARRNLKTIVGEEIIQDSKKDSNVKRSSDMSAEIENLSSEDFDRADTYAVVPPDMDNSNRIDEIEDEQVTTYLWSARQLGLLHEVVREATPWR